MVLQAIHPKLFAFVEHSGNPTKISPSQVLKIIPYESNTFGIEQVYLNDGSQISGSSVALPYEDYLYIGGVFEKKILKAQLNKNK